VTRNPLQHQDRALLAELTNDHHALARTMFSLESCLEKLISDPVPDLDDSVLGESPACLTHQSYYKLII
jgi:hypothetical protein